MGSRSTKHLWRRQRDGIEPVFADETFRYFSSQSWNDRDLELYVADDDDWKANDDESKGGGGGERVDLARGETDLLET